MTEKYNFSEIPQNTPYIIFYPSINIIVGPIVITEFQSGKLNHARVL